jgi:hypothetical protein
VSHEKDLKRAASDASSRPTKRRSKHGPVCEQIPPLPEAEGRPLDPIVPHGGWHRPPLIQLPQKLRRPDEDKNLSILLRLPVEMVWEIASHCGMEAREMLSQTCRPMRHVLGEHIRVGREVMTFVRKGDVGGVRKEMASHFSTVRGGGGL